MVLQVFALILSSLSLIHCQSVYYIIPTESNAKCPYGEECHSISYYARKNIFNSSSLYFVFLSGEHILDASFTLESIDQVSFAPNDIVMKHYNKKSIYIIKCTDDEMVAFRMKHIRSLYIDGLTITECGSGLHASNVSQVQINYVSIHDNKKSGMILIDTKELDMGQCHFHHNCLNESNIMNCFHAAVYLPCQLGISISIINSNFSSGSWLFASLYIADSIVDAGTCESIVNGDILLCHFYNNSAIGSGGLYTNTNRSVSVAVQQTMFVHNSILATASDISNVSSIVRGRAAAGISASFKTSPLYLEIIQCHFESNAGYGVYVLYLNSIQSMFSPQDVLNISNTTFVNNTGKYGAAITIVSNFINGYLSNVSIVHNTPPDTQLVDYYSALLIFSLHNASIFISNGLIADNKMTGLLFTGVWGSVNFINEPTTIINNYTPRDGGGMWTDISTTINTLTSVYLINNTALRYGGALFSNANLVLSKYYYSNYKCLIANAEMNFLDNKAIVAGNDIYGGRFFNCWSLNGSHYYTFDDSFFQLIINCSLTWNIYNNVSHPLSLHVSSNPFGVCFCGNHTTDCYNRSAIVSVYPGQWVGLPLATVGMCGGISPGVLVIHTQSLNVSLGNSNQQTPAICKQFLYQLNQLDDLTAGSVVIASQSFLQQPTIKDSSLTIHVTFKPCPSGLQLKNGICDCNGILANIKEVVHCNISTPYDPITRSGNNWLYYSHDDNCTIAYENCPFDYCNTSTISLGLDDPDVQCSFNRSGILCGQCQPGLSIMLGSNRCDECTNTFLSLIVIFAVAGVALIAFLFISNMTVSNVYINGLLFYANVVKLNENVFFPTRIPMLTQFISWLNLDLGFQTCFFNGLNGYWKTWLQYAFPLYIWFLIGGIIILCHHSTRLSRLCGNNSIKVLATLILMSYTKLLRNIKNSLMMTTIKCNNMTWRWVWSVDGNVSYMGGIHIPLFIVSVLFLLTGITYTLLIFTSQWLQHFSGKCCRCYGNLIFKLIPFIDAYSGPYKDKYRYWTGLLLIIRVVMVTIFSYTSGTLSYINNYIIVIHCIFLIKISSNGIYESSSLNKLEFTHVLNLLLLSLMSSLLVQTQWSIFLYVVTAISVSLSMMLFFGTLIISIYQLLDKKFNIKLSCWKTNRSHELQIIDDSEEKSGNDADEVPGSPARLIQKRESLILDIDFN